MVFGDFFLNRVPTLYLCLKQGIKIGILSLNAVGKSTIFVLNRVRVCGARPQHPTNEYIEYPLGGSAWR